MGSEKTSWVMEHVGPPIKTTERGIMKNADGTCCFIDSLLVALLFPSYRGFFDNNLLDPDLSTAPTVCEAGHLHPTRHTGIYEVTLLHAAVHCARPRISLGQREMPPSCLCT